MARVLLQKEKDNVITFLEEAKAGETVEFQLNNQTITIEILENIPFGHKMAICDIPKEENVTKYGEVIGLSTSLIKKGSHAHVHNIESLRVRHDLKEGSS